MEQPLKVAIPAAALAVLHPERLPFPGLAPIVRATVLVSVVTTLAPASSMATTGWAAIGSPATVVPGEVVNASCAGGPAVMLNGPLAVEGVVRLSAASVAVRV